MNKIKKFLKKYKAGIVRFFIIFSGLQIIGALVSSGIIENYIYIAGAGMLVGFVMGEVDRRMTKEETIHGIPVKYIKYISSNEDSKTKMEKKDED